jgi:5-methylcytosine-specific restriction endonuclease McrA
MARVVSRNTIEYVLHERDRACLYGFMTSDPCKTSALHVHHIQKRSQIGGDTEENLITLCAHHHDMAERHIIHPEELIQILGKLYGYNL